VLRQGVPGRGTALPPEVHVRERDEALTWAAEERVEAAGRGPEGHEKQADAFAAAVLLHEVLEERRAEASCAARLPEQEAAEGDGEEARGVLAHGGLGRGAGVSRTA
jgi:hypothetical protein